MEPISWQAPAFHYYEKSAVWYTWSIVVAIAVVLLALLQGNMLFVFFVVLAEAVILLIGKQQPRLLVYEVTEVAVIINNSRQYPYLELAGFSMIADPISERYVELVLHPSKRLATYTKILVPVEHIDDLKAFLSAKLTELAYEESVSENIIKRIGL